MEGGRRPTVWDRDSDLAGGSMRDRVPMREYK
jgi:hypothetical protein